MISFLLYLLLWIWDNRSFDTITQANKNKSEAEMAYIEGDYRKAADLYHKITYGSLFVEPASRLYLAHSYFHLDSLNDAYSHYHLLEHIADASIASTANAQLALIEVSRGDTLSAIQHLTLALKQIPDNAQARYNYELLKKTFSGKVSAPKEEPAQAPPPPEPAPAQPLSPEAQQSVELAEQREELLQRLRKLNMSEDQARAILDAMKSNEAQYIYQLRRRQYYNHTERSNVIEW